MVFEGLVFGLFGDDHGDYEVDQDDEEIGAFDDNSYSPKYPLLSLRLALNKASPNNTNPRPLNHRRNHRKRKTDQMSKNMIRDHPRLILRLSLLIKLNNNFQAQKHHVTPAKEVRVNIKKAYTIARGALKGLIHLRYPCESVYVHQSLANTSSEDEAAWVDEELWDAEVYIDQEDAENQRNRANHAKADPRHQIGRV